MPRLTVCIDGSKGSTWQRSRASWSAQRMCRGRTRTLCGCAPALDPAVMASARRIWAQQYGAAIGASTSQYFRLQQLESNSHIRDLEHALETLRELEQQRAQLWQQAAHDLRGNLGVVANVTEGLTSANASEVARANFLRMLDRNVSAFAIC